MNLVQGIILALWVSAVVLASSVGAMFVAVEGRVSLVVLLPLFGGLALVASVLGALLARRFPNVRVRYSLLRLTLAAIPGWPIAWWTGLETKRILESAPPDGILTVSFSLHDISVWNGAVVLMAFMVLAPWRRVRPQTAAGAPPEGGA